MNEIHERLAAGILYVLSLVGNPCQDNLVQPVVNQENVVVVKQDSIAKPDKKEEREVIITYAGEREVDKVKDAAEIRINKREKLERLVEEKYGGREAMERATSTSTAPGYKLMLPFDSFENYLLGRFYSKNEGSQGDVWIYGKKPFRLTRTPDVRESACFVPLGKEKGLIYLVEDYSRPALSTPEQIPPKVYCMEFGIKDENIEIKNGKEIILPKGAEAVYYIAYDGKQIVLDLKYNGNKGSYVLDGIKLYKLENKPQEDNSPEGKK